MEKRRSNLGQKASELMHQGEPEGAEVRALKRVAELRGIKPSNRHAQLSQRWRAHFEKYSPR